MKFIPLEVLIFKHKCSFNKDHKICDHYFDFTLYNPKNHTIQGNLVCMDCMDMAELLNKDCKYMILTFYTDQWKQFIKQFPPDKFVTEGSS